MLLKIDKKLPVSRNSAHFRSSIELQTRTSIGTATGDSVLICDCIFVSEELWLVANHDLDYVIYRSICVMKRLMMSKDWFTCFDIWQDIELDDKTNFSIVTLRAAAPTVFHLVLHQCERELDDTDWVITRVKADTTTTAAVQTGMLVDCIHWKYLKFFGVFNRI